MTDERLEALGTYFVHHRIRERYDLTFEQFIQRVESGVWKEWCAA